MNILADVDQAECFRQGVNAPSSTVKIDVDPKTLTEDQRNFVADHLYDKLRFPSDAAYEICPPSYEGFIAAVNYGVEAKKLLKLRPENRAFSTEQEEELTTKLRTLRQSLITAAIKADEKRTSAEPKETGKKFTHPSTGLLAPGEGIRKPFGGGSSK
jgi:hypothetical protein